MDTPEVRRRSRAVIDQAKRGAAARRERADAASRDYEAFLQDRAVPTFHTFAAALVAEGARFKVFTPAGAVRLAAEGGGEDFIEIVVRPDARSAPSDRALEPRRGRRSIVTERSIRAGTPTADLTDEDVLEFLVEEIAPFVER